MHRKDNPEFSFLLPVKNGGAYLPLCVESILAQNYKNFDLIILENKSTDGTAEWLQTLEKRESRVKVIPSEISLSIEDNWQRILKVLKNEFMSIIGHDDLLDPNFIEEINKTIHEEPGANLYLTHYRLIDSKNKLIRYCRPMPKLESAAEFLAARMAEIRDSFGTGYVMRSKLYDEIGGIPPYPNLMFADDTLWMKLIGSTFRATSPNVCFSYRFHEGSISGNPNQDKLFLGLKKHLGFLQNEAKKNDDLANVIKHYGPEYISRRCQYYYYYLIGTAPWGRQIDTDQFIQINELLKEFTSEVKLRKVKTRGGRLFIKYFRQLKIFIRSLIPYLPQY
ncbi:MAG: glycosyltransferase [Desulfobacula sp.]|nr:glycosyltransferase [Desulfobacula sp.]